MTITPHGSSTTVTLHHGDCLDILSELPDNSVDSVVTDPPYGLEFMGKEWDSFKPASSRGAGAQFANGSVGGYEGKPMPRYGKRWSQRRCDLCGHVDGGASPCQCAAPVWTASTEPGTPRFAATFQQWCELWTAECFRVLKPGGHLLAFGGTRTWHRLACAVEDAGFEVRDSIAWMYGSGFPKSLDVSKAIDKAAGAERGIVGPNPMAAKQTGQSSTVALSGDREPNLYLTVPATPDAERWQGWGTALKPAFEPVVVARKPLAGTVAANVLAHGTGALNVDGCRVGREEGDRTEYGRGNHLPHANTTASLGAFAEVTPYEPHAAGRWPANVVLDESQAAALDQQSGERKASGVYGGDGSRRPGEHATDFGGDNRPASMFDDQGGASRFFYTAKAATDERVRIDGVAHPTVKPLALMRWLVRLVTPPGGTVLEPFAGSGTTVEACILEGFRCIAIEREADYLPLIMQRINRRVDPVAAVTASGEDGGLFDLLDADTA